MRDTLLDAIAAHPDGIALTGPDGRTISRYRLVDAVRSVRMDRIGEGAVWLAVDDPIESVISILGCLGFAETVLLDGGTAGEALDRLAAVRPPSAVVTDWADSPLARWAAARGLLRGTGPGTPTGGPGTPTGAPASPAEGTALTFLTSGTTGAPQAVALGAAQILAAATGVARRLGLGRDDVSLTMAPQNHTLGFVTGVLTPLVSGGSVVFGAVSRPAELVSAAERSAATWCAASPGTHRMLLQLASAARFTWPGLRFLRSSAAPLPPALGARLADHYQVPVVNAYVLTEAPGEVSSQPVDGPRRPGTAGVPTLSRVEIRRDGRPAAAGEVGVVAVRGPNVFPAGLGGDGWYETGDLGRIDPDGELTIVGRRDDVINRGGFKIAPYVVEAAAREHPAVLSAAAFPIPHEGLGQLAGLVVTAVPGTELPVAEIRGHLAGLLSRRLWPDRILVVENIPTNARGKIARRELAAVLLPGR